jgi:hypothetical protein
LELNLTHLNCDWEFDQVPIAARCRNSQFGHATKKFGHATKLVAIP